MSTIAIVPVVRYHGFNSRYADIGVRGTELLGLSVQYAIHPSNVGCFVLRFVAHGEGVHPANFSHLTYRESAKFVIPEAEGTPAEAFNGLRLNKLALPVFKPAVRPHEVAQYATSLDVWPQIMEWVVEQVEAEGFTLVLSPTELMAFLLESVALPATTEPVSLVLSFPNLKSPAMKQAALAQVQDPVEDDDEDEEDEDEDEDEDDLDDEDDDAPKSKASKYN